MKKKEFAIKIYRTLEKANCGLPQKMVKVGPILKQNDIDYKAMGYTRMKDMFSDLCAYFQVTSESPTDKSLAATEKLLECLGTKNEETLHGCAEGNKAREQGERTLTILSDKI